MKLIKTVEVASVLAAISFMLFSCNKEYTQVAPLQTNINSLATVQVINATVKATRNYIYVDGTAVSGSTLAYGGIFPGTAYAFSVTAGSHSIVIKDTLPTTTQIPITFTQNLDAGKFYTIFTYDTITSIKQLTVLNNIIIPADTTSMLRFANFIYNPTSLPNVDVYSFRRGTATPVFTNVATAQVTDFIPYASGLIDTLYVYATGTTTPLIVKQVVSSLTPTRSYTALYSGSFRGTKTVATFITY